MMEPPVDANLDYYLRKQIPDLPMRIYVERASAIKLYSVFVFVFLFVVFGIYLGGYAESKFKPISKFEREIALFIGAPFLIVSIYFLIKYSHLCLIDRLWLEITDAGIKFRTGYFMTLVFVSWTDFKSFHYWIFDEKSELQYGFSDVYVFFKLKKHSVYKSKYISTYSMRKFDGYIQSEYNIRNSPLNVKFNSEPDRMICEVIFSGGRNAPFVHFLNYYRKLYSKS